MGDRYVETALRTNKQKLRREFSRLLNGTNDEGLDLDRQGQMKRLSSEFSKNLGYYKRRRLVFWGNRQKNEIN